MYCVKMKIPKIRQIFTLFTRVVSKVNNEFNRRVVCFMQVSAYTLVAISVDRYIAIMWPLKPRASRHHAKYIIALVWTVAIITAFPILLVTTLDQPSIWHQVTFLFKCYFFNICLVIK